MSRKWGWRWELGRTFNFMDESIFIISVSTSDLGNKILRNACEYCCAFIRKARESKCGIDEEGKQRWIEAYLDGAEMGRGWLLDWACGANGGVGRLLDAAGKLFRYISSPRLSRRRRRRRRWWWRRLFFSHVLINRWIFYFFLLINSSVYVNIITEWKAVCPT